MEFHLILMVLEDLLTFLENDNLTGEIINTI